MSSEKEMDIFSWYTMYSPHILQAVSLIYMGTFEFHKDFVNIMIHLNELGNKHMKNKHGVQTSGALGRLLS